MMAFFGINGLGWFLCGVVVAPTCYIVTSQGAAERARLHAVETGIADAKKDIRGLETEFNARANMGQLEQWKAEYAQLSAPGGGQYLASETEIASIDRAPAAPQTALTAPPAPALQPQPAVEPQPAVAQGELSPKLTAALEKRAPGTAKARTQAVAMLDDKLLSASTIEELQRRARTEQLALR